MEGIKMTMNKNSNDFLTKLYALLNEYGASIYFACGESSDLSGIDEAHLEICTISGINTTTYVMKDTYIESSIDEVEDIFVE
jgi:hypothetical protein